MIRQDPAANRQDIAFVENAVEERHPAYVDYLAERYLEAAAITSRYSRRKMWSVPLWDATS